jgi:hypothetical protein
VLCRGDNDLEVATCVAMFGARRETSLKKVVCDLENEVDVLGLLSGMQCPRSAV